MKTARWVSAGLITVAEQRQQLAIIATAGQFSDGRGAGLQTGRPIVEPAEM